MTPACIRIGEEICRVKSPEKLASNMDSSIWVNCRFDDCDLSGAQISNSMFTECHFKSVCLYWCHAFRAAFIDCEFVDCDLRGAFDEARFVKCRFTDCEVGDNNLGGTTEWEDAVSIECVVRGEALPIVAAS